ncbi:MAG TPA: carbohydrate binding domain-containing protein, partial [Chitinophagaceae bacterium]|nr:carbohydrate binding domain-containing protein [Chitinophagaceae bacterium]
MKRSFQIFISLITVVSFCTANAQIGNSKRASDKRLISPDLFGIFFEDLNYAADGGLYAELVQNRSFEYSPGDRIDWDHFTSWEFFINRDAIANISIESTNPVHPNNPHYLQFKIENGTGGTGVKNNGFDGINIQQGEKYIFSLFTRQLSGNTPLEIKLQSKTGTVYAAAAITDSKNEWTKQSAVLTATQADTSAVLTVSTNGKGVLQMDMISLFPVKTFRNRSNGLRADLAQVIADLKPKFMRFPGGCLVHGNGVNNIYNWKNTIGAVETRAAQPNIWRYHQTLGLGYFEYFQFCEDIDAKPLPVIAAGVSCQNSGHTRGTGQACVPMADMQQYTQDILDLIEYANGPVTSTWGSKRAASGHPAPFNLTYVGIGNEDKITPEFEERFKLIYEAIKSKYPEIIVIGTVGPAPDGG